ncbi:MAG: succinate dehydrogenase, partial [Desulforhopalus sp.]|nr:succinate dehydrogenase [Desulforhopalus sp.]
ADPGGRTLGSNTMPYTGIAILFFVVIHLFKFTFADKSETPIYDLMAATFSSFSWTVFYIAGMAVVGIHLSHGFWSLLQTFGLQHPDHTPVVEQLGLGLSIAIGVGFSLVPVYLLIFI